MPRYSRQTDPRRTEVDYLKSQLKTWFELQDSAPDERKWEMCDVVIKRLMKSISAAEYIQEWVLDEDVYATRHQFRGQGL